MKNSIFGRLVSLSESQAQIQNFSGQHWRALSPEHSTSNARPGDIVELTDSGQLRVLTPNRNLQKSATWMEKILSPRRQAGTRTRAATEQGIREFFLQQNFIEVRTPVLVPCPGMETHIRPFEVYQGGYLQTSPEFAMKKLLVGGMEKIFQICPVFRSEPHSTTHRPEFTMLEWYRAFNGYEQIMRDTEELFFFLAKKIHSSPVISYQGKKIDFTPPWPRLRVRDLFMEMAQVDLVRSHTVELLQNECRRLGLSFQTTDTWDDLYFRIWLNVIEPRLPENRPIFVTRYPASQSALAVVDSDPDGSRWARRFELYAGGIELGNAFEELTDPNEQRIRFVEDMNLREKIYGDEFKKTPIDEEFLQALTEGMPPSGGIAVGVDRMIMLMADESDIEFTRWL